MNIESRLRYIVLALCFFCTQRVYGSIISVDCSSPSAVNTGFSSASSGDTVQCNASGSYTWSTAVTIPNTKNLIFDGNSAHINGTVNLPSSASYQARITNITFNVDNAVVTYNDAATNLPWRIDHCTFDGTGLDSNSMIQTGIGPGLIDNNTFTNLPFAKETIHNVGYWAWTSGAHLGWNDTATPGSSNALYIEKNTVSGAQYSNLIQTYYGARTIIRFNTFTGPQVDYHGNNTPDSARWWEIYDNSWSNGSLMCLRGGSGVIWGNTGNINAYFVNETSDNVHGVGHGQNDNSTPAYLSNNGSISYIYNQDGCSFHNGTVTAGTDVITASYGTTLPATCNTGDGYLKTNDGSWNTSGAGGQGIMYKCTATNMWTTYHAPYPYPYPLSSAGFPTAGINYVQGNNAVPQTPQSSVSVTYTGAQTAGNLNVVVVGWSDSTVTVSSVVDSSGNTYRLAVGPTVQTGYATQAIYYASNIAAAGAGANTVIVQFSGGANYPDIRILEYSGVATTNPVDGTAANSGNSASSDSGSATTTNATDLIFGANLVQTSTTSAGSGFTSRMITNPDGDIAEDQVVTATGSYNATAPLSASGPWIMQMVAFRSK